MEGSKEANKEISQSGIGQKQKNQNQYKSRQPGEFQKARKAPIKPKYSANSSNNTSDEIEQHQPASTRENNGNARWSQSNEGGVDNNGEKSRNNNSNVRRGQNAWYGSRQRGGHTEDYSNRARNTNSDGFTEIRNGKKQPGRGGNSFRSGSRGRGQRRGNYPSDGTGRRDDNRNGPASISQNIGSTPTTTENQPTLAVKPNAWTDNAFPITKAFENTALKGLLPETAEEEDEMVERALQLSLNEIKMPHGNHSSHPLERKNSSSSDVEEFNEAEEAKKMLQPNDFPPLSVLMSSRLDGGFVEAVTTQPKSEIVTQLFETEKPESEPPEPNFTRKTHPNGKGENEIGRSNSEAWDRYGARPKKKAAPAGRGFGRGRKGSEGKIGELVASSVSTAPSALRTSPPTSKPKSTPNTMDSEQFEPAELGSDIPKTDLASCSVQSKSVTGAVPSQDAAQTVDPSNLPSIENALQVNAPTNVAPQVRILSNATDVPESATQHVALLDTRQTPDVRDSFAGATLTPFHVPLVVDVAQAENTTEEPPPHIEIAIAASDNSDSAKDEEIRILKEELNRLKHGLDGNHYDPAHYPPPYGVMPLHVPYLLPMPYYRYPFPGMPVPIVRNDGMFDSSLATVPYMPNAANFCNQEMIPMQQMTIPEMCNEVASISMPSGFEMPDRPDLTSSLSPTAEVFHPKKTPPAEVFNPRQNPHTYARSEQGYNHEGRKQKPRPSNYNKRGNGKNFHGQYQNNYSSRVNQSYDTVPNFASHPFPNNRGLQNLQLPLLALPDTKLSGYTSNWVNDHGPPAF